MYATRYSLYIYIYIYYINVIIVIIRVSSLDHVPTYSSSKVTGCEKCCSGITVCTLTLFNLIDLLIGIVLISFGVYLELKIKFSTHLDEAWLCWSILLLGILLILTCVLSTCAVSSSSCRWASIPSAYIGLFISLLSLVLATAALILKNKIFNYINNNEDELGLSSRDVTFIENWYSVVAYVLFGLFILEIVRYRYSINFRETALRIDGEFDNLLEGEEKQWKDRFSTNKQVREEKYNDLRAYYKSKYNNSDISESDNNQF